MHIQKNKRNGTTYYYLSKSYRDRKSLSPKKKIVESLGSHEELYAKHGKNLEAWLKEYAKKRTLEETKKSQEFKFPQTKLSKNNKPSKNIGYIFIDLICQSLGLQKLCKKIETKENIKFSMYDCLLAIIVRDLLNDSIGKQLISYSSSLYNFPEIKQSHITKTIKLICKYNLDIQKTLYKNAYKDSKYDNSCIYYDCSNYGTVGATLENLKYNKHYSDNITLGKIFMDSNLIPCGFAIENELLDTDKDNIDVLKNLKYKFNGAKLYALPYCLETKTDSSLYNRFPNHHRIDFCSVKDLNSDELEFCLDSKDWDSVNFSNKQNIAGLEEVLTSYDISSDEFYKIFSNVYYKNKTIDNQNLFSVFSFESKYWFMEFRHHQLKRYQQAVEDKLTTVHKTADDILDDNYGFVKSDIKDKETKIQFFDDSSLRQDEKFDGFIALKEDVDLSTLHTVAKAMIKKYNECDLLFELLRTECYKNKDLTFKESLLYHFLISYVSYFVLRYLEYKLDDEFWFRDIVTQLSRMNIFNVAKNTWIPTYNLTKLIDRLLKLYDLKLDYNFITDNMLNY